MEHALSSPPTLAKSLYIWESIANPHHRFIRGKVEHSSLRDFSSNATVISQTSGFGELLIKHRWLPNKEGVMHKPGEISLDELPEVFTRHHDLATQLGMKTGSDSMKKALEELGFSTDEVGIDNLKKDLMEVLRSDPALITDAARRIRELRKAEAGERGVARGGAQGGGEPEEQDDDYEEEPIEGVVVDPYPHPELRAATGRRRSNAPPRIRVREEKSKSGVPSHKDCTLQGERVRSKNEVVVANILYSLRPLGVTYEYEKSLLARDKIGPAKQPDFTIDYRGKIFVWEHTEDISKEKWKEKAAWYRKNRIRPIVSTNGPNGEIDSREVYRLACERILGGTVGRDGVCILPDDGGESDEGGGESGGD